MYNHDHRDFHPQRFQTRFPLPVRTFYRLHFLHHQRSRGTNYRFRLLFSGIAILVLVYKDPNCNFSVQPTVLKKPRQLPALQEEQLKRSFGAQLLRLRTQ